MGKFWRNKSPLCWLWALPIVGFFLVLIAFNARVTPLAAGQPFNNQPAGEIRGAFTVGQTFYSPYPGLYKIDVLLATYAGPKSGPVTFYLTPGVGDTTRLATIPFDASQVQDNMFRSFEFSRVGDSAGKTYYFYLEAPGAQPGNAITAWSDATNPYLGGAAYLGGLPAENDVTFVAYFSPTPWEVADTYLGRLANDKPGIWGSKAFYAVSFTVYLALSGALLYSLFRWVVLDHKDRP